MAYMHPFLIDQLAQDRWAALHQLAQADAASRRRRRALRLRARNGRGRRSRGLDAV
jgi:hypothetical protein